MKKCDDTEIVKALISQVETLSENVEYWKNRCKELEAEKNKFEIILKINSKREIYFEEQEEGYVIL